MARTNKRAKNGLKSIMDYSRLRDYYKRNLLNIVLARFEYKNVPESLNVRYLEEQLVENGVAIIFKDDVLGLLALKPKPSGRLNVYGEMMSDGAISGHGVHFEGLDMNNSVMIYNDMLHGGEMDDIMLYSEKLAHIDMVTTVNLNAIKTPVLINCAENEVITMKNMYQQYQGNEPVIFADKGVDRSSVKVLKTDAPYLVGALQDAKGRIFNEFLTRIGVENGNSPKKERLISSEVNANNAATVMSRYSPLQMRQEAIKKVNKMFGTNITVDYRQEQLEEDDETAIRDKESEKVSESQAGKEDE
jgi:hypothetical protein